MRRSWKTFFVGSTVLLTAVNPASACRGRFWRHCPPSNCYVSSCDVQCAVEVDCCDGSYSGVPTPAMAPSHGTFNETIPQAADPPARPTPAQPTPARPAPTAPAPSFEPPMAEPPAVEPPAAAPSLPVDDMPLPTETPAEPPAAEPSDTPAKPSEDVEDLFKDTDATPAAPPADTAPADDAPADAPPADAAPEKPAEKADDLEDLFKDTDEKKAATSDPAQEVPMDQAPDSEVEDLFSEPTDKPSTSASLESSPNRSDVANSMRTWTDNTGKYHVRARLVKVGDGHVKLLKETGKYTTVPFAAERRRPGLRAARGLERVGRQLLKNA